MTTSTGHKQGSRQMYSELQINLSYFYSQLSGLCNDLCHAVIRTINRLHVVLGWFPKFDPTFYYDNYLLADSLWGYLQLHT